MEDSKESVLLIRAGDVTPLIEDDGRYLNYPAFPFQEDRLFETYRIQIEPGGGLLARPHMAGTEGYITVFTGSVEIDVNGENFQLLSGDSLRFKADVEHSYKNTEYK